MTADAHCFCASTTSFTVIAESYTGVVVCEVFMLAGCRMPARGNVYKALAPDLLQLLALLWRVQLSVYAFTGGCGELNEGWMWVWVWVWVWVWWAGAVFSRSCARLLCCVCRCLRFSFAM